VYKSAWECMDGSVSSSDTSVRHCLSLISLVNEIVAVGVRGTPEKMMSTMEAARSSELVIVD
jgi:hypothetical protein